MTRTPFTPLGPVKDHFWLMTGMAKSADVDLAAALSDGRITQDGYADLVTACRQCSDPGRCKRVMDSVDGHPSVPTYCENADIFADLSG